MFISGYGNQYGNSKQSLEMPLYSIIIIYYCIKKTEYQWIQNSTYVILTKN